MKVIFLFTFLLIAASCGTQKETVENLEKEPVVEVVDNSMLIGKVRISEEGCPLYVETYEEGKMVTMYPVNLEESLKVNGTKIKFTYNYSRGVQPENCNVDKVVSLENVEKVP